MTCSRRYSGNALRRRWHTLWCRDCRAHVEVDNIIARGVAQMRSESASSAGIAATLQALQAQEPDSVSRPIRRDTRSRRLQIATLTSCAVLLAAIGLTARRHSYPSVNLAAGNIPAPTANRAVASAGTRALPSSSRVLPQPDASGISWPSVMPGIQSKSSGTKTAVVHSPLPPVTSTTTTVRIADDLTYMNSAPADALQRWVNLSPHARTELDAQWRMTRGGDDFVRVPFPQVAGTGPNALQAAARAHEQEAAIADARLARRITLAAKGMAFADLCQQIAKQTGIELVAGRSVEDDKVTVYCTDKPLRDLMRQINRLFGFIWLRSGETSAFHYELAQDLRGQLLEEELRNRDRNEALLALDNEMQKFRAHLSLTPAEARAMAASATGEEKKRLEALGGPGWAAVHLYFDLSPDELTMLRAGQTLEFKSAPKEGERALPSDVARSVLGGLDGSRVQLMSNGFSFSAKEGQTEGIPPSAIPNVESSAGIHIDRTELGKFTLAGSTGFIIPHTGSATSDENLAVGISPSVRSPGNAEANAKLAHDPAFRAKVTLIIDPTVKLDTANREPNALATTGDFLEALHKATGRDVIGDYYTRLFAPDALKANDEPLFDALNRVGNIMFVHWSKDPNSDWLQFRSASFFNDRLKEVPDRLLRRWAASRRKNSIATLNDLAEMSQLTDAQLDSQAMADGARAIYGLREWQNVREPGLRPHWRFLAGFSAGLRQEAAGPGGLKFRNMPLAQQQQFLAMVYRSPDTNIGLAAANLGEAYVRVVYPWVDTRAGSAADFPDSQAKFTYRFPDAQGHRLTMEQTSHSSRYGNFGDTD